MKRKRHYCKRLTGLLLAGALMFTTMMDAAFAAEKLYDQATTEVVTKGVTYEFNHRLNTEGWQDIHVLKINLNDPNLAIAPVESKTELGLKETVLQMISESGAVAGVNADFFGMKGAYSASFGPVIKDGEIQSVGTDRNLGSKEYSTFFLDEEGNPFIDFLTIQAEFYANNYYRLELASLNKITEMVYPIYFDRNGAETTADLDKRFPELVKFVIEDNVITKISEKGETITAPENGYLIILNGSYYDDVSQYYQVGQTADLRIQSSLDLDKIQTAISGAGKILADGEIPADPGLVITGRQPRTALGISQDKSTLILMVVDGRTHSIGATHDEMAWLMREYGAYNAMHFDGGGSSTMVVKTIDDEQVEVKNTVSDGAQRKVMNSLGVFNNGPQGPAANIVIHPSAKRVFVGSSVSLDAVGYDEYYHKTDVANDEIVYSVTSGEGEVIGNTFTPSVAGKVTVTGSWNGITAQTELESMQAVALTPSVESITLANVGESSQPLGFSGVSPDGFTASVNSGVTYTLSDDTLGVMHGNVFTALREGSGYITCQFGGAVCYIPVTVAAEPLVDMPKTPTITDAKMGVVSKADDGAYYINIIGAVSSKVAKTPQLYDGERQKAKDFVETSADLAIYNAGNDISLAPAVDTIKWSGEYQFYDKPYTSIVQMTAAQGGLRATNPSQWLRFKNDILSNQNPNIIFIMDETPSNFSDALETQLFRNALEDIRKEGRNVFVVSSSGTGYWSNLKDGIRYINLPRLFTDSGETNPEFAKLKFRVEGNQITYEKANMY